MRWILIAALFTLTVYGDKKIVVEQGFTVHQMICEPGKHHMVYGSARYDEKTGKYLSNGRPIEKCVKTDEMKPKEPKKKKEPTTPKEEKKQIPDVPYVVKILKYGSPHGTGKTFSSKALCEQEQAKLNKANAGLDYSYVCVKR